jgi:molybdopterin synthase catalytic subunit
MIRVVVDPASIEVEAELARLEANGAGGIATFTGLVRADDGVEVLELEHYPGVTERALTMLAEEARGRWLLNAATIVHRVGPMRPGERIVFVGTAAAHRAAALEACAYLIDRLKTDAPFWKRETRKGESRWVDQREGDLKSAARWD